MTQLQFHTAQIGQKERLLYYALRLTSDADNTQDLVQVTFLLELTYRNNEVLNIDLNKEYRSPGYIYNAKEIIIKW